MLTISEEELATLEGMREEFKKFYQEAVDPGLKLVWSRQFLYASQIIQKYAETIQIRKENSQVPPSSSITPTPPTSTPPTPPKNLTSKKTITKWVRYILYRLENQTIDPKVATAMTNALTLRRSVMELDVLDELKELQRMVDEIRAAQSLRIAKELDQAVPLGNLHPNHKPPENPQ